jgi:hypothetical protein
MPASRRAAGRWGPSAGSTGSKTCFTSAVSCAHSLQAKRGRAQTTKLPLHIPHADGRAVCQPRVRQGGWVLTRALRLDPLATLHASRRRMTSAPRVPIPPARVTPRASAGAPAAQARPPRRGSTSGPASPCHSRYFVVPQLTLAARDLLPANCCGQA